MDEYVQVPQLIGTRIKAIRPMTPAEVKEMGWGAGSLVIELETGVLLFAMGDEEGNRAGVMVGEYNGGQFYLTAEAEPASV